MSGCADHPAHSDTNDGLSKHKERTFVTTGPAWQHVCGVRASLDINWFPLHSLWRGENITLERFIESTSVCC